MRTFSLATVERPGPHQEPEEARRVAALVVDGRLYPLDTLAPRRPELHVGLFDLLQRWDAVSPALQALAEGMSTRNEGLSPDDRSIRVLTPIRYPRGSPGRRARRVVWTNSRGSSPR